MSYYGDLICPLMSGPSTIVQPDLAAEDDGVIQYARCVGPECVAFVPNANYSRSDGRCAALSHGELGFRNLMIAKL